MGQNIQNSSTVLGTVLVGDGLLLHIRFVFSNTQQRHSDKLDTLLWDEF